MNCEEARAYFRAYIDRRGVVGSAEHLGVAYSTLAGICNGSRGIGRGLAQRLADADPELDAGVLVWVRPTKEKEAGASVNP